MPGRSEGSRTGATLRNVLTITWVTFAALGADCGDDGGPSDPVSGDIQGLVTGDGTPRDGVTITLSQGGSTVATVVTPANGRYRFSNLDPGAYTVAVSEIAGMNCPGNQIATVVAGGEETVDFACTTSANRGTVEGRVTVNDVGVSGAVVILGETRIVSTGGDGIYRFVNVPLGDTTVRVREPEDVTTSCPSLLQPVSIVGGGTATVDFDCTGEAVTGQVTVNGVGEPSVTALLCDSNVVWDALCHLPRATDSNGRFAFTSFREGIEPQRAYYVIVNPPLDATCPVPEESFSVATGETVTVDVACVRP